MTAWPDLEPMDIATRIPELRNTFGELQCDVLIVTNLVNVRYLTGFTGTNALLAVGPDGALLCTDGRYAIQAHDQLVASRAPADVLIGKGEPLKAGVLATVGGSRMIGLESMGVTWNQQREFAKSWFPDLDVVPTLHAVERLRQIKDAGEVARVAMAGAIGDAALAAVLPLLVESPTETEIALALEYEMRRGGAEAVWPSVIAVGPNAAEAHHVAGARRVRRGDLVVMDFGCLVDGYHSDMTRTHCVGQPSSERLAEVFDVVRESQQRARDAIRPGVSAAEVDALAREVIAARDPAWADTMTHGSGHGIGLAIHEDPIFGAAATDSLIAGQVLTMEPGVYLAGEGGVRIEDTVVVTQDGCVPLTNAPKELAIA